MMKAALVRAYGAPAAVIGFSDSHTRPELPETPAGAKKQRDLLLVKVQACSLSPGDVRTITGEKALITKTRHAHGFPFIPCGDVCGTIVDTRGDAGAFAVGDSVVATWDMFGEGGMAEYAIVERKCALPWPALLGGAASAECNGALDCSRFESWSQTSAPCRECGQRSVLILHGTRTVPAQHR